MQIFRLGEKTAIGLGFENANGDYILAGLESAAHRIHAWVLDPCTAAHGFAVDVDRVHALNLAEVEHGAASRKRVGESDLPAEPDKCRRIGHAQFRESAGDWHRFPRRVIVIVSGPIVLLARVVPVVPVHDVVAVFGRVFGFQQVELGEWDIEVMERTKRVRARPSLRGSTANRVHDDPDGNVHLLLDLSGEIVADGGDPGCGFGRDDAPVAIDHIDMVVGGMTADGVEANVGVVGRPDLLIGILCEPQGQTHVGLPAAEPHVADQDIVQFSALMAGDLHGIGSTGRRRLNLHLPPAIGAGSAGCGVFADLNLDGITRIGPAPDGVGLAALQDHVVAKDGADERKWLGNRSRCRLTRRGLRAYASTGRKQHRCHESCAINVSGNGYGTHDCKPLAMDARGPCIESCGRPGCHRFRCIARALDKGRAGGCGQGMLDRWR